MTAPHARISRRTLIESGAVVWLLVVLIIVWAAWRSADFRSLDNLANVARQLAVLGIASAAQFAVVLSGGVDLSIGANVRLSAIVAAMVMNGDPGRLVPGVVVGIIVGAVVGGVNAVIVARLSVEPFIATLGTGALVSGAALYLASTPVGRSSPQLDAGYGWSIGPIYAVTLLVLVVWVGTSYATRRTRWGAHLYAAGGDAAISRLAGVNVARTTASAYVFAGALGGLAGLVVLASAGVGDAALASGLEFDSLAVVVLGGASLAGGRGRLLGVIGGVLLFTVIGNVFNILQIDVWYQQLVQGIVILVAAAALVGRHRRRPRPRNSPMNTAPQPLTEGST